MSNFTSEQVKEKVLGVLKNYIDSSISEIPMEASMDELGLDSFKAIYLLLDLEEAFGIQIPDSMLAPEIFASPKALKDAVESILNA